MFLNVIIIYIVNFPSAEIVLPTSVSLPGYRGRFVSLLCHIFPGSEIYTPYQLTWGDRSLLEGVKSQGSFSYFLSFAGNPTKLNTTCMGERAFNSSGPPRVTEASVSVVIVGKNWIIWINVQNTTLSFIFRDIQCYKSVKSKRLW